MASLTKLTLVAVGLVAALMLIQDPFMQIFAVWLMASVWMQVSFRFRPQPLKVLMMSAVVVSLIRLTRKALQLGLADGDLGSHLEQFIVDWGVSGAPMKCGGNMEDEGIVPPTHTATCDIWSDPEQIIDQRVDRVLESTRHEVKEMEDFLHTNLPDGRTMTERDEAEALIV